MFAFGDIPHGTETEVSTTATPDDEQFAGGTEVKTVWIAFGEGDDSSNLEVVGIVKDHLSLATNSHERGPWADGDSGGDTGALGAHKGVERKHFHRHGCGAFGSFAERIGINSEIHLRLVGHDRLGAGGFKEPPDDPFFEYLNLLVG